MKEADRSENPGLGEKEGSITFCSLDSASAGGGHGELLLALTSGVPGNPHVHLPLRPQAEDAEGVTRALKAQGQSPCDQHTRGRAPEEPFAVLSLFPSCINYEEQPLLSGIFWCVSLGISRLGTGSQGRTSFQFWLGSPILWPSLGALLQSLFNLGSQRALSTVRPARLTSVSQEGSGSWEKAGRGRKSGGRVGPQLVLHDVPGEPPATHHDLSGQVGVLQQRGNLEPRAP